MPNESLSVHPATLLPEHVRLLHIGFHKTGTTSVQTAFAAAREEARVHGVTYPGKGLQHSPAALGLMDRTFGWPAKGGKLPRQSRWKKLVREVEEAPGRVLMSSEFLEEASTESIQQIRDDLGERLHVVATVRNLGRMLPSIWQQHVKNGLTDPYPRWLKKNLINREDSTKFWVRHDHPRVIGRWAAVVGAENVTVVVVDESDRSMLFNSFETMLGLPSGLLSAQPTTHSNRSMTSAEAELLRRINRAVKDLDIQWPEYQAMIRKGAALRMVEARRPDADEVMIGTPDWALDRAAELGASYVDAISALGVNVVGDLSSLAVRGTSRGETDHTPTVVPIDAAVEAMIGCVGGAMRDPDSAAPPSTPAIATLSTRELVRYTSRRLARSVVDSGQRARGVGRGGATKGAGQSGAREQDGQPTPRPPVKKTAKKSAAATGQRATPQERLAAVKQPDSGS